MSLVKSNRPRFVSLAELAATVRAGERIAIGGHHFARLPLAALTALAAAKPVRLRYFAWAGGLPLELLLEAGLIAEIDLCFSSLDIFGMASRFRQAAESGAVPLRDWPALAMIQALRAAQQNLPYLPLQLPAGSDLLQRCPALKVAPDAGSGRVLAQASPVVIDSLFLHALRADAAGNVEIYGATALDLALAAAAKKVLVTVEEIAPAGALAVQERGRQTILLRNQVSLLALAPGGAWPTSCLPHYVTDYQYLAELFAGQHGSLQAGLTRPDDKPQPFLRQAAKIPYRRVDAAAFAGARTAQAAPSVDELMAIRLARLMDNDCFASAGAVSPLANVAYRLAKATHAPHMMLAGMSGGHIDYAAGVMTLSLMELLDAQSAVAHCGGDDCYSVFYQAGAVTHEIIGAAQVDGQARINNLQLTKPSGGALRLPGQGGMADVANMHRDLVVYATRHSPLTLVREVEFVSAASGLRRAEERRTAGYQPGEIWLLTNLCLFRFDEAVGQLVVAETLPCVKRAEIEAATGFTALFAADCQPMSPPTDAELRALREQVDPLGIRRLEFCSAKERGRLIEEQLAALCNTRGFKRNPIKTWEYLASEQTQHLYCPFAFGYSNYSRLGFVANRLHFGPPVTYRQQPLITVLGGAGLGISRYSVQKDAACQYAQFIASELIQDGIYCGDDGQPGYRSAWLNAENNRQTLDYFQNTLAIVDNAWLRPRFAGYIQPQEQAARVVQTALTGAIKIPAAIWQINDLFTAIHEM